MKSCLLGWVILYCRCSSWQVLYIHCSCKMTPPTVSWSTGQPTTLCYYTGHVHRPLAHL